MSGPSPLQQPNPHESDQAAPKSAAMAVAMVILANVAAIGYIFWTGGSASEPVIAMVTTTARAGSPAPKVDNAGALDQAGGFDDDDWVDEPIRVFNEVDLPSIETTRALYSNNCAICHGAEGRGDGAVSDRLIPPPRDFVATPFRYAAEWADENHLIADLERTVRQGVPRSAMPAFGGVLREQEIAGLARYILALRDEEQVYVPEALADVGARPPLTTELVRRGEELYTSLACVTCHGETGAGDGPNAESLVDFQQRPVRPADFTSGLYKTGQRSEDLVRAMLRGVPGTPMVAYEGVLLVENDTDEESYNTIDAWALAAYIRTLAPSAPPPGLSSGAHIPVVPALADGMLTDPIHPAWIGVVPAPLRVNPLQQHHEEISHVEVRAVATDQQIAICVEWTDSTPSLLDGTDERHPDGLAVIFGIGDALSAVQAMAMETNETEPGTNEWWWDASRQYACVGGDPSASQIDQPEVLRSRPLVVLGPGLPAPESPAPTDSAPSCEIIESNGMRPQAPESQGARTSAAWINGVWRVVVVRSLNTDSAADVQLEAADRIPISIAVWDGAVGDRLSAMAVSSWHWIERTP